MKRTATVLTLVCGLLLLLPTFCPKAQAQVRAALTSGLSGTVKADRISFTKTSGALEKSRIVTLSWDLDARSSIRMSSGYAKYYSSRIDGALGSFTRSSWKMRSVPLTVSYSYALTSRSERLVPSLSIGGSAYLARTRVYLLPGSETLGPEAYEVAADVPMLPKVHMSKRYFNGVGYGFHAGLDLKYDLGHGLFAIGQAQARFIDGHALTLTNAPGRFTSLDVVLGLGYRL